MSEDLNFETKVKLEAITGLQKSINLLADGLKNLTAMTTEVAKSSKVLAESFQKEAQAANAAATAATRQAQAQAAVATTNTQVASGLKRTAKENRNIGNIYKANARNIKGFADNHRALAAALKVDVMRGNITGMQRAAVLTDHTTRNMNSLAQSMKSVGQNARFVGRSLTTGVTLGLALGAKAAVEEYTRLDKEITRIAKVYGNNPNSFTPGVKKDVEGAIKQLSHYGAQSRVITAAIMGDFAAQGRVMEEFGDGTAFMANDVIKTLGKLGTGVKTELQAMAAETARISILGDIDLSTAKEQITSLMAVFAEGVGIEKFADQLGLTQTILNQFNAIENATRIEMKEIAAEFPQVALAARNFNLSAAQTAAVMAVMTKAGIATNEAVTALRFSFSRLQSPPDDTRKKLKALGSELAFFTTKGARPGIDSLVAIGREIDKFGAKSEKSAILIAELFGARQGNNKMIAAVTGVSRGYDELASTMKRAKDEGVQLDQMQGFLMSNLTNDFARAIAASGEFDFLNKGADGLLELMKAAKGTGPEAEKAAMALKLLGENAGGELNRVLKSDAFKMAQLKADFRGAMADMGKAIFPIIRGGLDVLVGLLEKINNMSPQLKTALMGIIVSFAAIGPLMMIFAAVAQSFAVVGQVSIKTFMLLARGARIVDASVVSARGGMEKWNKTLVNQGKEIIEVGNRYAMVSTKKARDTAATQANTAANIANAKSIEAVTHAQMNAVTGGAGATAAGAVIPDKKKPLKAVNPFETAANNLAANGLPGKLDKEEKAVSKLTKAREKLKKAHPLKSLRAREVPGMNRFGGAMVTKAGMTKGVEKLASPFKMIGRLGKSVFGGIGRLILNLGTLVMHPLKSFRMLFNIFKMVAGVGLRFTAIGAVLGLVGAAAFSLAKHFKSFKQGMSTGWNKLKAAIQPIIDLIKGIFAPLAKLKGAMGDKEGMNKMWENVGKAVGFVMDMIGRLIKFITPVIKVIAGVIEGVVSVVVDVILFVIKLIQGDWVNAFKYLGNAAVTLLMPIIKVIEFIADVVAKVIGWVAKKVGGFLSKIPSIVPGSKAIKGFAKDIKGFGKEADKFAKKDWGKNAHSMFKVKTPEPPPKSDIQRAQKKYKKAGVPLGTAAGEGVNEGAKEEVDPGKWLGALKNRIDKAMDEIIDSAKKAYDEMQQAQEEAFTEMQQSAEKVFDAQQKARTDAIDAQIKAIDDLTNAEEKAMREEEYRTRRLEMLKKKQIDSENYMRDRALAIYEGRVDDARTMDLEHKSNMEEVDRDINELDRDHNRQLVLDAREAQKQMLEDQKTALDAKLQAEKEAFEKQQQQAKKEFDKQQAANAENMEKQLQQIRDYTPRTVAEMQSRMDQIAAVLGAQGAIWQWHGGTASDLWARAVRDAKRDLEDDAYWNPVGKNITNSLAGGMDDAASEIAARAGIPDPVDMAGGYTTYDPYSDTGGPAGDGTMGQASGGATSAQVKSRGSMGGGGNVRYLHTGGHIPGPPSDVPATLQGGEFVIQRATVKKFGPEFFESLNQGYLPPKFHSGGFVPQRKMMHAQGKGFASMYAKYIVPKIFEPIKQQMINRMAEKKIAERKAAYEASVARAKAAAAGPKMNTVGTAGGDWRSITEFLRLNNIPHRVNSTTGGKHVAGSYHYRGKAVDLGDPAGPRPSGSPAMMKIYSALESIQTKLAELFYTPAGRSIKNGKVVRPPIAAKGHYNHVHAAVFDEGGPLKKGLTMAMNKTGKSEYVLTNDMLKNLASGLIPLAAAINRAHLSSPGVADKIVGGGGAKGDTYYTIEVENFIGEKAWFEKMMKEHNLKVQPKIDRARGGEARRVGKF